MRKMICKYHSDSWATFYLAAFSGSFNSLLQKHWQQWMFFSAWWFLQDVTYALWDKLHLITR